MKWVGFVAVGALCACSRLDDVGKAPTFTPNHNSVETMAMHMPPSDSVKEQTHAERASLWSGASGSLLGDRRATGPGDILTVVIEIDESAEISNGSTRLRTGSQTAAAPSVFGLEGIVDRVLPNGVSLSNGLSTSSSATSTGDGSVSRNEQLTLRIAATVVERLPNGVMRIEGSQEVRVDFEIRELLVSGYVRPADISRRNEVTYDKIAAARVSYGGRGLISNLQQPPVGHQAANILMPY